jgi:uncharacterized membrane protein YedE/YeeE
MSTSRATLRALAALVSGTVFGVGLAVAQMTNPRKVLDFLDFAGRWDASLLLVLGAATGLYAIAHFFIRQQAAPVLDAQFHWPVPAGVDASLLGGSALFGIGWGIAGYCPGPAVASLGFGNAEALWVVPSIVLGIVAQRWRAAVQRRQDPDHAAATGSANAL